MTDAPLTVPSDYVEDFHAALIEEIATDARHAMEERAKLEEARRYRLKPDAVLRSDAADLRMNMRLLAQDGDVLAQVERALEASGDLEVYGDPATLAHVCDTMAREIVSARISAELEMSPISCEAVRDRTACLHWAVENAERLHELGVPDTEAVA